MFALYIQVYYECCRKENASPHMSHRDPEALLRPDRDHIPRQLKITLTFTPSCVLFLIVTWMRDNVVIIDQATCPSFTPLACLRLVFSPQHSSTSNSPSLSAVILLFRRILDCSSASGSLWKHRCRVTKGESPFAEMEPNILFVPRTVQLVPGEASQPSAIAANLWTRFSSPSHYLQDLPRQGNLFCPCHCPFLCVWVYFTAALAVFSPFPFSLNIQDWRGKSWRNTFWRLVNSHSISNMKCTSVHCHCPRK